MQTLSRPSPAKKSSPVSKHRQPGGRKRVSPLMFISLIVTVVIVLGIGAYVVVQKLTGSHAAAANGDCTLIAPANPLSAKGLATPWQLVATDPANGACDEANAGQAAFVQGAVVDPATGKISIFNPLVINQGTQPAVAPTAPTLPKGAVVALWMGFNGNNLTLKGNGLGQGKCVNGTPGSIFGQFAYCNAPAFFAAANKAIQQGLLKIPALGTAKDGHPCPTVRDFSVVDMDPSDNVTATYLISGNGQMAQMSAANAKALPGAQVQKNGSDNRLLAVALDGALGCTPFMAPDLADGGNMVPALPLNELQAAMFQKAPRATVPAGDAMTMVNGQPNLTKLNLYRVGVNQTEVQSFNDANASTKNYCANLFHGATRIMQDAGLTQGRPSPDPAAANSLFTFLGQRYVAAYGPDNLNCQALIHKASPISVTNDANGVTISVTINGTDITGGGAPDCVVDGNTVAGCAGTTTIGGQDCTFAFANNAVTVTCQAAAPGGGAGAGAPAATPTPAAGTGTPVTTPTPAAGTGTPVVTPTPAAGTGTPVPTPTPTPVPTPAQ